eukprot:9337471-Pyramimonas_sp.AAC.1
MSVAFEVRYFEKVETTLCEYMSPGSPSESPVHPCQGRLSAAILARSQTGATLVSFKKLGPKLRGTAH